MNGIGNRRVLQWNRSGLERHLGIAEIDISTTEHQIDSLYFVSIEKGAS